jgi:hypothetical protein
MARAFVGFTVGIAIVGHKQNAEIVDARAETSIPIAPGDYRALVTIFCGEQIHKVGLTFKVGKQQHETHWV